MRARRPVEDPAAFARAVRIGYSSLVRITRFLVWWLRTLAILALLFASVQTTHHYFYCEAMGLLQADPCGRVEHAEHGVALTPSDYDCCHVVTTPSLPNATGVASSAIRPALVTRLSRSPVDTHTSSSAAFAYPGHGERGPPPPTRRRAELMIFLT